MAALQLLALGQQIPKIATPRRRVLARTPAFDLGELKDTLYPTAETRGCLILVLPDLLQHRQNILSGDRRNLLRAKLGAVRVGEGLIPLVLMFDVAPEVP